MPKRQDASPRTGPRETRTLTDDDMITRSVDRRSFLAKAFAAGSVGLGAAMTAACPGSSDASDGSDADSETETDTDSQP